MLNDLASRKITPTSIVISAGKFVGSFFQTSVRMTVDRFSKNMFTFPESYFGSVPTNFSMDNVACTGDETSLHNCRFSSSHNCDGDEAAGVSCMGK